MTHPAGASGEAPGEVPGQPETTDPETMDIETTDPETIDIETPVGMARVLLYRPTPDRPAGALVLGHGAGGGVGAVDLVAVMSAALAAGWQVALVEQPWKVAGRKVAAPPGRLDVAWTAVVTALSGRGSVAGRGSLSGSRVLGGPLVLGGRSAGARVACRTAGALGAAAVCCLAFPLHPPGRPERSRADELAACPVPVLVVQGRMDA